MTSSALGGGTSDDDAPPRRVVAIFRQNLFRISEPFITEQAERLVRYAPFYLGRRRYGAAPAGARSFALADRGRLRAMPAIARQMATRAAAPFERGLGGTPLALIHAHFGIDAVHAMPLARARGIPLVTTFHGFDATLSTAALFSSPAWVNYPIFRASLARRGALFLCVSRFIRDRVLAQGFPPSLTRVHYTGVDCRTIAVRDAAEERPVLLQVGRLVAMKGTATAIDAFARLADRHPALRLRIVGDGALRRGLEAQARQTGFGDRIEFLGALPHGEVLRLMRAAAVLVLPSVTTGTGRTEGLGMVLLEAAATGVPVVASAVGGIPEGVQDGRTGLLVASRDAGALADALDVLLADEALRRRMGADARRFVEQRFDNRSLGRALERLYDEVSGDAAVDGGALDDGARAAARRSTR